MSERRLAILPIEYSLLTEVLRGRVKLTDLPDDMEIVGVHDISLFRMVELRVKSESFGLLHAGHMIPRLNPLLMANYEVSIQPRL